MKRRGWVGTPSLPGCHVQAVELTSTRSLAAPVRAGLRAAPAARHGAPGAGEAPLHRGDVGTERRTGGGSARPVWRRARPRSARGSPAAGRASAAPRRGRRPAPRRLRRRVARHQRRAEVGERAERPGRRPVSGSTRLLRMPATSRLPSDAMQHAKTDTGAREQQPQPRGVVEDRSVRRSSQQLAPARIGERVDDDRPSHRRSYTGLPAASRLATNRAVSSGPASDGSGSSGAKTANSSGARRERA